MLKDDDDVDVEHRQHERWLAQWKQKKEPSRDNTSQAQVATAGTAGAGSSGLRNSSGGLSSSSSSAYGRWGDSASRAAKAWPQPRSGHTMAYCRPPYGQTPFVALFGGYDLHYHNDLWVLPVGQVAVPSLLNLCGQVLQNRPDLLAAHYTLLPEELRHKLAICWLPARGQRWMYIDPANRYRFAMPKRTTSGMRYINGRLWLFGGSEGSPSSNDIYCFDFAKREWSKVDATGTKPKPTNYVQITTMGSRLVILSHTTLPNVYFFDTEQLRWTLKRTIGAIVAGDEGSIGIAHGCLYQMASNCEGVSMLTNVDDDESEVAEWIRLPISEFPHRIYITGICFVEDRVFFIKDCKELWAIHLPSPYESRTLSASKLTLTGDTLFTASSGVTMCGSNRLLIAFGGCGGHYIDTTYAIYLSVDYQSANVVNLNSVAK